MVRFARGLALALLLFGFLMVFAPARLLGLVLPADQVLLQGFAGTLWQGSASRCLVRTAAGYLHLGSVQWSLEPLSLLVLAPRLTLSSVWGDQVINGQVVLHGQLDLEVHDFEARVAADLLRQFAPVALTGKLSLELGHLELRDGLPYSGAGRLMWQEGGWQSPRGLIPLGTYALDFQQAPGDLLDGEVITLTGPLEATGTVQLEGRRYQFDILMGSEDVLDAQLEQALSLFATPEGGAYRASLDGEF